MAYDVLSSEKLLTKVKSALGITGDFQNDTLNIYIDEVKHFMLIAGVKEDVVNSSVAVGLICRGVTDLWNYGSGHAVLSDYFKWRVTQLALDGVSVDE